MFIPLHDGVAMQYMRVPVANYTLIAINVVVFLVVGYGPFDAVRMDLALGVIPAVLFDHAVLAKGLALVPAWATLVTSLFLHGSFLHLAGNMLFLWVFGDNVEDAMGSKRYVAFYLLSGAAGALLFAAMAPTSEAPLIGASGAIAGVIAAYLIFYPQVRVFGLVFNYIPLRIPAIWCMGAWIILQVFSALTAHESDIGWWAHVGGFAFGAALAPFVRRREVALFSPRRA